MATNGKKWTANKADFTEDAELRKVYNNDKYRELGKLLEGMCNIWPGDERVKTLKRKVLEEVSNIIQHNKTGWSKISVWTGVNPSKTKLQIEIWYDSDSYYDPEKFNNINVMGSTDKFQYKRGLSAEKIAGQTKIEIEFGF